MNKDVKIVLTGGAGLVGQNLVVRLKSAGYTNIVVLDKHSSNLDTLRRLHPDVHAILVDLAEPSSSWQHNFDGATIVVILHAQIGGVHVEPFVRNNVTATQNLLQVAKLFKIPYMIHISSSVVESVANDYYTNTKKDQERLVVESGLDYVVLRPTLMFGWYDRKHLGWLARFMQKVPIFPIPGDGRFMRQPLYVRDFCSIIIGCIEQRIVGKVFNITGLEKIDYIDIIREIKNATHARTLLVSLPYSLFYWLLKLWAVFDSDPPFTAAQLQALVAHDEFEVVEWPQLFNVTPTPFRRAIDETFNNPHHSSVILDF